MQLDTSFSTMGDRVAAAVEAVEAVGKRWTCSATTAVILGTGLGELAEEVRAEVIVPYSEIPGYPRSTALAHKGCLVCGELDGAPVVMMQGRCHLYEGCRVDEVALPVRVLSALGIETLIVTNAAGGLNPQFVTGDVMVIDDHIDMMWLPGLATVDPAGPCRVHRPQVRLYDRELVRQALQVSRQEGFPLQRGVYISVTGPCYETRAEYRAFRKIGGDCVGMSTVPEVLTAAACGMRVLGLSTITNVACPDAPKKVSADEVVEVAELALPKVRKLVQALLSRA